MAAALDRARFFKAIRSNPFDGSLTQSQVDGIGAMLDMAPPGMPARHLAHCFAEAFHETGGAMIPRVEDLTYTSAQRIAEVWPSRFSIGSAAPLVRNPVGLAQAAYGGRLGNLPAPSLDGWTFRGMGLVQATGKDNAIRATKRLRELGYLTPTQDLVATPSLMLNPDIAAAMLYVGLSEGWYTGRKLAQYFNDDVNDPIGARALVNGDVRTNGGKVGAAHNAFLNALNGADYKPYGVAPSVPTPSVATAPLAPPVEAPAPAAPAPVADKPIWPTPAPTPKKTFWQQALENLRNKYPKG